MIKDKLIFNIIVISLTVLLYSCLGSRKNIETPKIKPAESKKINGCYPEVDYFAVRTINENLVYKISGNIYQSLIARENFEIRIDSLRFQINKGDIFVHRNNLNKYALLEKKNNESFGLVNYAPESFRTYVNNKGEIRFGDFVDNKLIEGNYFPADEDSFNLKELVFESYENDTLKIGLYQFKKQYKNPSKIKDFYLNMSKNNIIAFKGLIIKVYEVNNIRIKYKILKNSCKKNAFEI